MSAKRQLRCETPGMATAATGGTPDSVILVAPGPAARIEVRGDVDVATCPHIDDVIASALRGSLETLTLDLEGVSFMGSSGLASLLRAQRRCEEVGAHLLLDRPSRAVRDLLAMTHLTNRFEIVDWST